MARAELLRHDHHARLGWDAWLAHHGEPPPTEPRGTLYSDYALVLRAATAGQGIALGWHHLVRDLVTEGALARVGDLEVVTNRPLPLLARPDALGRPAVRAMWDWLMATAAEGAAGSG